MIRLVNNILIAALRIARPVFDRWPKVELFCALVIAGAGELRLKWIGLWLAMGTRGQVSAEIRGARLEVCRACPIFFKPLSTCGSALHGGARDIVDGSMLGCGCNMQIKAGTLANGWLYERDKGQSILCWPKELNSFPYEDERPDEH